MKARINGRLGLLVAVIVALVAVSAPATAGAKDANKDRIPDRWEKGQKLSLKKDQRKLDQDRDGLKNRGEWLAGTKARDKDSDDDGTPDGRENAGVISSYDTETQALTVTLYAGGEIAGTVTDRTRVKCDSGLGDDPAEETPDDPGSGDGTALSGPGHGGGDWGSDDGSGDESGDDSGDEGEDDSGHHGPGPGPGPDGRHGGCHGDCSLEDLAEGVEILEADVKYTADGPVFTAIEIDKVETEG